MKTNSTYSDRRPRGGCKSRFARGVAACLSESADAVAPDVAERLRFAREKALAIARRAREGAHGVGVTAVAAPPIAGFSRSRWWLRFASVLPLVALVGGLVLIQRLAEPRPRSRSPPKSTRPCWPTTCRPTPTAIPASRSS